MTEQTQPPVLSTPESRLFEAPVPTSLANKGSRLSDAQLHEIYEIPRTAREIHKGGYTRVALQFPDEMLCDAPRVFAALEDILRGGNSNSKIEKEGSNEEERPKERGRGGRIRLYILADTSYGSCCVDEVAAEHVDADVVVHYGRACLSPTARLPVVYVFTTRVLEIDGVLGQFEAFFNNDSLGQGTDEKVVVMADLTYQSHVPILVKRLREKGWLNVRATEVVHDPGADIPNRKIGFEDSDEERGLKEWTVWHVGMPPDALLLTLSARIKELLIYTPGKTVERANSSMQLRRRYALLTRLSTAGIIGILVNTLSVKNYLDSIAGLKKLIENNGKKSYTFVVGKVNAAKMANFSEVGGWVVVGCWESSLLESKDFYQPVVTPFELALAMEGDESRVWGGEWSGDFEGILEKAEAIKAGTNGHTLGSRPQDDNGDDRDEEDSEEESAPPEFDLRTGRYVSHSRPLRTTSSNQQSPFQSTATSKVLTRRPKQELATVNGTVSPGAEYLKSQRTWTGLGSDFESGGEGGTIEEGRGGIARGYRVGEQGERT